MTLFLQICAALGGLTFLGGIITALAMWRKAKAEAGKTGADTIQVLTDNALKAASSAIENLSKQLEQTQEALTETRDELQAVRRHMGVLEQVLRQHQILAPEFVWPSRRNGTTG